MNKIWFKSSGNSFQTQKSDLLTKMRFKPIVELQSPQPFSLSLAIDIFCNFRSFLLLTRIGHSGINLCNYINMVKAILGKVKF